MRNTKIVKGGVKNTKNFNHHDPLQGENKSRSLGRKTTEMNQLISGQMPYGKMNNNIRDSSVSNNSNAGSSLAAYTQAN